MGAAGVDRRFLTALDQADHLGDQTALVEVVQDRERGGAAFTVVLPCLLSKLNVRQLEPWCGCGCGCGCLCLCLCSQAFRSSTALAGPCQEEDRRAMAPRIEEAAPGGAASLRRAVCVRSLSVSGEVPSWRGSSSSTWHVPPFTRGPSAASPQRYAAGPPAVNPRRAVRHRPARRR